MDELLNKWDNELTIESIVSRLLHLQPTEDNLKKGCEEIEKIIEIKIESLIISL